MPEVSPVDTPLRRPAWAAPLQAVMVLLRTCLLAMIGLGPFSAQAATAATPPTALIYASRTAQHWWSEQGADFKAQVNLWRDLLRARGEPFEIVTRPERLLQAPPQSVLILPSLIALTPQEREVLLERLARGDHLLVTGYAGLRDETGQPVHPGFLTQLMPVALANPQGGERNFIVTAADTPLTQGLPAGTRLWIDNQSLQSTPRLKAPQDAYLSDWSRQGDTGVLAHATVGRSRRALLGWPESAWTHQPAEYALLAQRALDWVQNRPLAYPAAWPWPHRGALTWGVDATWRFESLDLVAQALGTRRIRGTFNLLSSDVAAQALRVQQLLDQGQAVGALADRWEPFGGQPEAVQDERVRSLAADFARQAPKVQRLGLRPPEGRTDEATERASRSLRYLVDVGRVDTLVPQPPNAERPVVLSNPLNIDASADRPTTLEALNRQAQVLARLGGHAYIGLNAPDLRPDSGAWQGLEAFWQEPTTSQRLWMAPAADVADWVEAQLARAVVRSELDGNTWVLTLKVDEAAAAAPEWTLWLYPPAGQVIQSVAPAAAELLPDARIAALGAQALRLKGLKAGVHQLRLGLSPAP